MADISEKKENYKELFGELQISKKDEDRLEKFLYAYSYFILKTNKNYKYNLTYLQSYLEDFIEIKRRISEKTKIVNKIIEVLELETYEANVMEIRCVLDSFWILLKENDFFKNKNVMKEYTGEIDSEKLMSSKCVIEVQVNVKDGGMISITKKIDAHDKIVEREMKDILKQIRKLMESR